MISSHLPSRVMCRSDFEHVLSIALVHKECRKVLCHHNNMLIYLLASEAVSYI